MANLVFDFLHNYHAGERRDSEPANAYQYDEGHVIEAVVPVVVTSCEIHYWIRGMEKAEAYVPDSITPNADGTCTVIGHVPNEYFQTNGELRVYIVVTDGDASITTYEGRIQVYPRSMPDDYVDDDPDNEATRVLTEAREAAATATAAAETCEEVQESIPSDYSTLSNDVADLKAGYNDLKEDLPFIDVNSMALMTDVTKLYRYDGSLYFYNGSEWAEVGTGASGDGIILVSLASDMTDTSSVYLYNGTETGYVSGHWYYYDTGTSAWTDGGNYTGWGTIESVLAGMTIEIQTKEIGVLTLTFGNDEYIYDGSSDVSIILADADTTSY